MPPIRIPRPLLALRTGKRSIAFAPKAARRDTSSRRTRIGGLADRRDRQASWPALVAAGLGL